jgi:hypothetical protein
MGWPLFAVSMAAAAHAAWKHKTADVMLLAYALVNYVAISTTSSDVLFYPRYALPIIVVLAILSGRMLAELIGARARWSTVALPVFSACLVAWPLATAARNSYTFTRTDTRTLAKQWFDGHVPSGSKVLIEGTKIAASRLSVPLSDSPDSLDRRIAFWESREPRQARYLQVMRRVHEGGGYELEFMQIGSIEALQRYAARGVEYVVVRPAYMIGSRRADSSGARFMRDLHNDATMIMRFVGETADTPGPTIEIYRVRSPVPSQ